MIYNLLKFFFFYFWFLIIKLLINKKEKKIIIFKKNKFDKNCNEVCHKICREKSIITKENYEIIPQIPFYYDCGIKMKHILNKKKKK